MNGIDFDKLKINADINALNTNFEKIKANKEEGISLYNIVNQTLLPTNKEIKDTLGKYKDLKNRISELKNWEKDLQGAKDVIILKRVCALLRLALQVSIAAGGVLAFIFLNANPITALIVPVASLLYFIVGFMER